MFFLFYPRKKGLAFHTNMHFMSPSETIFMKYKTLCPAKKKKENISKCYLLKIFTQYAKHLLLSYTVLLFGIWLMVKLSVVIKPR